MWLWVVGLEFVISWWPVVVFLLLDILPFPKLVSSISKVLVSFCSRFSFQRRSTLQQTGPRRVARSNTIMPAWCLCSPALRRLANPQNCRKKATPVRIPVSANPDDTECQKISISKDGIRSRRSSSRLTTRGGWGTPRGSTQHPRADTAPLPRHHWRTAPAVAYFSDWSVEETEEYGARRVGSPANGGFICLICVASPPFFTLPHVLVLTLLRLECTLTVSPPLRNKTCDQYDGKKCGGGGGVGHGTCRRQTSSPVLEIEPHSHRELGGPA